MGFGRANVSKIGQNGYSILGSKHNSPVLWAAIRELAEKLVKEIPFSYTSSLKDELEKINLAEINLKFKSTQETELRIDLVD